jgi:hypothetical protein
MRAVNLLPRDDPNRRSKTNVPVVIGVAGAVLTTALVGMMFMSASSAVAFVSASGLTSGGASTSGVATGCDVAVSFAGWSAAALGVIALSVLSIWAARRWPYITVGWFWYLGTLLPVIGVPIQSVLNGLDSLLSTVQMPKGIPVATVAIGASGATNAALLAVAILAGSRPDLREKLRQYREELSAQVQRDSLP